MFVTSSFAPSHSLAQCVSLSVRRSSGSWEDSWSRLSKLSQISQERSHTISSFLSLTALSVFFSWLHFCPTGWPFSLCFHSVCTVGLCSCPSLNVFCICSLIRDFYYFMLLEILRHSGHDKTLITRFHYFSHIIRPSSFSLPLCNVLNSVRSVCIALQQAGFPLKAILVWKTVRHVLHTFHSLYLCDSGI